MHISVLKISAFVEIDQNHGGFHGPRPDLALWVWASLFSACPHIVRLAGIGIDVLTYCYSASILVLLLGHPHIQGPEFGSNVLDVSLSPIIGPYNFIIGIWPLRAL